MWSIRRWELWRLPGPVRAVVLGVVGAGVAVAVLLLTPLPSASRSDWLLAALLMAAGTLSDRVAARTGRARSRARSDDVDLTVSTESVWVAAAVVALPVHLVALVAVALGACVGVRLHRSAQAGGPPPGHRLAFNLAMVLISSACAALAYRSVLSSAVLPSVAGGQLVAAAAAFLVSHLLETFVITLVMVAHGTAAVRGSRDLLWDDLPDNLALSALGLLLALAWLSDPLLVVAGIPVVVLLQRGLMHWHLQLAAAQDHKTGVASSSEWCARAEELLAATRARGGQLGVLVVDLDHFKGINDTHGHLVGDEVLVALAAAMRTAARDGDLVGRFGGDEFVVLLPAADPAAVAAVAERVRAAAAGLTVHVEGLAEPLHVTTSIGVATYPADGEALEDLLRQADRALYTVKHAGRGAVAFAPRAGTAPAGSASPVARAS